MKDCQILDDFWIWGYHHCFLIKCLKKEVPLLFTLLFKHFQWCPTINHPFFWWKKMGKPHWLILFGDHDLSFSPPAPSCSEASVHHGPRRSPRTRFLIDSPSIIDFAWFCIGKITHQSHHLQQVQDSPTAPPAPSKWPKGVQVRRALLESLQVNLDHPIGC